MTIGYVYFSPVVWALLIFISINCNSFYINWKSSSILEHQIPCMKFVYENFTSADKFFNIGPVQIYSEILIIPSV
jgi:hypothetical protein